MTAEGKSMMDLEQSPPEGPAAWGGSWPQGAEAFERLVEAFQDRLVRCAYRRLGSLADAEDVVQEVFARAYVDRKKRQAVMNVGAYLYRMTGNLCMDHLRRREKKDAVGLDEARIVEIPSREPDGATLALAAEELQRIEGLLGRIPERQAEAVRLCVFDELTPRQIGEILDCPEPTVRSRLRYGLEKLREIVTKEWEGLK
jgi:RNA polymerase sigma-70 factor (ECF subfamily)